MGAENRLVGLLCLKRDQAGFCTDTGVAARGRERARRTFLENWHFPNSGAWRSYEIEYRRCSSPTSTDSSLPDNSRTIYQDDIFSS